MKTFSEFQEDMSKLPGLGGGGGGTNAITGKSKGRTFKGKVTNVAKVLTRPLHKKRVDPNEKFATEGVAALAVGGSKLIPALMTGIGAAGTIMQAQRGRPKGEPAKRYKRNKPKRKISDMERKLTDRLDKQNVGNERVGKAFDTTGLNLNKKSKLITPKNGQVIQDEIDFVQYIKDRFKEKGLSGFVKPKKPEKKKKTIGDFIKNLNTNTNEEMMAAPTNNVGGGKIAGTVEAGDNPPVKKKKKTYAYGGRGSRKMWMNNK